MSAEDHGVGHELDAGLAGPLYPAVHVLGAGELLLECVQAEAGVDALLQDSAEVPVALYDEHSPGSGLPGAYAGRDSGRARAHHRHVHVDIAHLPAPLNQ